MISALLEKALTKHFMGRKALEVSPHLWMERPSMGYYSIFLSSTTLCKFGFPLSSFLVLMWREFSIDVGSFLTGMKDMEVRFQP